MDDLRETTTSMARLWINKDAWKRAVICSLSNQYPHPNQAPNLYNIWVDKEVIIAGSLWKPSFDSWLKSTTRKVEMVGNLTEESYDSPAICKIIRTLK